MLTVLVNALIAGIISGAGVIIAQMANGGGAMPTDPTWLVAGLTALISAGKDWQSHMSLPPGKQPEALKP